MEKTEREVLLAKVIELQKETQIVREAIAKIDEKNVIDKLTPYVGKYFCRNNYGHMRVERISDNDIYGTVIAVYANEVLAVNFNEQLFHMYWEEDSEEILEISKETFDGFLLRAKEMMV